MRWSGWIESFSMMRRLLQERGFVDRFCVLDLKALAFEGFLGAYGSQ